MSEVETSRDTVAIDEAVHDIYRQLTEGSDPIGAPFRTMKDVFMWAVVLGYNRGERRPLVGKRVTVFRWAQFSPQVDIPLLKGLAIADSEAVGVLLAPDQIIAIAEEYANSGIHELPSSVLDSHKTPLWHLIDTLSRR